MLYRTILPNRLGPAMFAEGLQGLIDATGREVLPPVHVSVGPFREGRAAVGTDFSHYGFVDERGSWVIEPRFERVGVYAEGRCLVRMIDGGAHRAAFVDEHGREVFAFPSFDESLHFSEGRLLVRHEGKVGFLDRSGALVIAHQFDQALPFREGLAPACLGERWGFVDLEGRWVIEPRWMRAFCFQGGVAAVVSAGRAVDGPFLRAFKKDASVEEFRGQWGLVDRNGDYLSPPSFDYVETELATSMAFVDAGALGPTRFAEGRAVVRQDGKKWGLLRSDGTLCGAPSFEKLGPPSEGLALAKKKVKGKSGWGFVDLEGAWVLPPTFASVLWPRARFSHGVCPVGVPITADQQTAFRAIEQYATHATGYVDRAGAFVIEPRFWLGLPFEGELAWVGTEKGWGYIDMGGRIVWEAPFVTR